MLENSATPIHLAYIEVRDADFDGTDRVSCYLNDNNSGNFSLSNVRTSTRLESNQFMNSPGEDQTKNDFALTMLTSPDREKTPNFVVRIQCSDQAGNSNEKVLRINVLDANDESPIFKQSIFRFHVPENTKPMLNMPHLGTETYQPVGHFLGKVEATDNDLNENGRIKYTLHKESMEIKPASEIASWTSFQHGDPEAYTYLGDPSAELNPNKLFRIDENTGALYSLKPFDAENVERFRFKVLAIDQPRRDSDGASTQHTGTATVEVTVSDVNDWSPLFHQTNSTHGCGTLRTHSPFPNFTSEFVTHYIFHVKENQQAYLPVGQVAAMDPDIGHRRFIRLKGHGMTSTSHITYHIARDAPTQIGRSFNLHSTSGCLRTKIQLDREDIPLYEFKVTARDSSKLGSNARTATATVTVIVEVCLLK